MGKVVECGFGIVLSDYFYLDFVAVIGTGDFVTVKAELSSRGEVIDSHLFERFRESKGRIYDILVEYFSLPPWVRKDDVSFSNMANMLGFVREETREVVLRFMGV